ncbi:MAG: hypothetical protein ISR95_00310 [Candidatus Marinimicrobia bacterium]|nr:hypothetical protein [Candidatus Neomarinimicrobiota bacterium]MBL7046073.1 hypothetical protein [Candidatus Neomarinimicrobiota bacterium]
MNQLKRMLLKTPFFSGRVPPIIANISHFTLGALSYWLLGAAAVVIPVVKESLDLWLWEKRLFAKHHKMYRDLAGWYCGMAVVFIFQTMKGG